MKVKVDFRESDKNFNTKFAELDQSFCVDLEKVLLVNRVDIPPE